MNAGRATNIQIIKKAVSSESGKAYLEQTESSATNHLTDAPNQNTREVDVVSIDDFVRESPGLSVGAIKIDAEGFEYPILMGAVKTIERDQPLILTEMSNQDDRLKLPTFQKEIGYSAYAFVKPPDRPKSGRFVFVPLGLEGYRKHELKMIFLVPPRLEGELGAPDNQIGASACR
jgi:hypothetical protein